MPGQGAVLNPPIQLPPLLIRELFGVIEAGQGRLQIQVPGQNHRSSAHGTGQGAPSRLIHAAHQRRPFFPAGPFIGPQIHLTHRDSSGISKVNRPSLQLRNSSSSTRAMRSVSISPRASRKPRFLPAASRRA